MKFNSTSIAFVVKAIVITCITFGISSFAVCHGQSIVGKWHEVSAKQFFTPEGSK